MQLTERPSAETVPPFNFGMLLNQPLIILTTVEDVVHVNDSIPDLKKDKVSAVYHQFMIFIGRDISFIKKRAALRHYFQRPDCGKQIVFQPGGSGRTDLSEEINLIPQKLSGTVGYDNPVNCLVTHGGHLR